MKRKFIAVFAVLLVVMLTTCDVFKSPSGEDNLPWFTPDGRPLVHIKINVGNSNASRALFKGDASANSTQFEVAFRDPLWDDLTDDVNTIYRKTWDDTNTGTIMIAIPKGEYTGAENAVVFAGTKTTPHILLGVGKIIQINKAPLPSSGPNAGKAIIDDDTDSITFELVPLVSAVTSTFTTPITSFKLLGPNNAGDTTNDYTTSGTLKTETVTEDSVSAIHPIYYLPAYTYFYTADFTDALTYNDATNIIGEYTVINSNFVTTQSPKSIDIGSVIASGPLSATSEPVPFGISDGVIVGIDPINKIPAAAGNIVDGKFYFLIDVKDAAEDGNKGVGVGAATPANGLSKVYISVPVNALWEDNSKTAAGYDPALNWNIKGGRDNDKLDGTATPTGGAILFAVGGKEALRFKEIEIWPNPPQYAP